MKRLVRAAGILATMSLLAGLLPSIAAQSSHAANLDVDITQLTYLPTALSDNCTRRGPKVVCTPVNTPSRASIVTAGGTLNVRYDAVVDPEAYEDQMSSTIEYPLAAMFIVRGFVNTPNDCTYRFSPSHLTTGSPFSLPNGLVVISKQVSRNLIGRVDGNNLLPVSVTDSVNTRGQGGKLFCAMTGVAVQETADGIFSPLQSERVLDNIVSAPLIVEVLKPQAPAAVTALKPDIAVKNPGVPFTYLSDYQIAASVSVAIERQAIVSRLLFVGTAEADGAACTGTLDNPRYYMNITSSGTRTYFLDSAIFSRSDMGRWLCTYQQVLNADGTESTSPVAYQAIAAPTTQVPERQLPSVNIPNLVTRLASSTAALRTALSRPQVNQEEVNRVIAEAEAARREAEEALRNGALANPGANAGGNAGANSSVPTVVEELDRIDELISRGKGEETARTALEIATGFDATVTPLLPLGSLTAAGLELIVTSPAKVKRARYLPVTVQVDPKNVRGRMRMFLLRYEGETPVVVRKRTGFIGAGSKSKRFYIYRNDPVGKYAILTSFDPTTPGQVGVATMTPLTVVR